MVWPDMNVCWESLRMSLLMNRSMENGFLVLPWKADIPVGMVSIEIAKNEYFGKTPKKGFSKSFKLC